MDCKYCAGAGASGFGGVLIVCLRCSGTGKEPTMTDDTASERVERWTVDRPGYRCPNCGGSDIGPLTVHVGDYVGVYWCPDCSRQIPELPQVEVIPVAPLLRWLDDLIERHTQGPLGAECSAAREGAELHIGIYEFVKAHIEGRDTHE